MDHFGIGFDQGRHVIAEDLELPIEGGDVVLFGGESGSGKSSLLRATAGWLSDGGEPSGGAGVVDVDALELGEGTLIDGMRLPVAEAMHALSTCGLGEAQLMLRTPAELSDGQRYRYRLARGLREQAEWLLADEFTATLDRTLARVIAYNIRRTARRTGQGFLLATTHEDVVDDLAPDVHVVCRLNGGIEVQGRDSAKKKERSHSQGTCGSAARPRATGRTSLGGIIAAGTSV
ncbi:MAG: ABC transporter [Planctomycetota bacterium]|nr:MAG: ABC transporter [Planctomycetota bacterium]REK25552.1 MAG: ABC transporter [Planctomycetota bacterium]